MLPWALPRGVGSGGWAGVGLRGWGCILTFFPGGGRFGYYLGTEKLLKFDGEYQTVICSKYFSETMMGNKIFNQNNILC